MRNRRWRRFCAATGARNDLFCELRKVIIEGIGAPATQATRWPILDAPAVKGGCLAALKSEQPPLIFQGMEISRKHHLRRVNLLLRESPVVALLGARQVGKSTLARQLTASRRGPTTRFDLENPADLARLADPGLELRPLRGLVVLDEIHRLPDVFPLLRVLADRLAATLKFGAMVVGDRRASSAAVDLPLYTHRIKEVTMSAIRLPDDVDRRLADLARKTGRTKTDCAREAILMHLEEIEDIQVAEERLATPARRWTHADIESGVDLEG